ncbi:hypothetical protein AMECASPLE_015547 [Ameca splendens]|uniref:Uncharacterized protein n=1 Tax=Ameca splendens TaxID=208324 RepID=A0ABV0Y2C6_9TELE
MLTFSTAGSYWQTGLAVLSNPYPGCWFVSSLFPNGFHSHQINYSTFGTWWNRGFTSWMLSNKSAATT